MKPVTINLVLKKNIWGKFFLSFVVIVVFSTIGITLVNMIDYSANIKVIKTYELRIKEINQRSERKRKTTQNKRTDKKQYQKIKQDLKYLEGIIKKNMFPLPAVLTEIERVKPDKIDINELIFSDNLKIVIIKGESNHVGSVSKFIIRMDRSKRFHIELSKEEINEDKRIIFELTARWISIENDQKT
jgi:hypothetical protein